MKLQKHRKFIKDYLKLSDKIQLKVDAIILDFIHNPMAEHLRNHRLHGKWLGCRSIDVSGDLRIIYRDLGENIYEIVELVALGSHSQLY